MTLFLLAFSIFGANNLNDLIIFNIEVSKATESLGNFDKLI